MKPVTALRRYSRFARRFPGFLSTRVSLDEARATIRRRLAERKSSLLRLLRQGVFAHERSPYRALLKHAGCELGDLESLVLREGVEGSLRVLETAGVYVSFDEFKGRVPIRRGSLVLNVEPRDFDNPFTHQDYVLETGGSTGVPMRVTHDLDHIAATTPFHVVTYDAHCVLGAPLGLWEGILPSGGGVNNLLRSSLIGNVARKWFSPMLGSGEVSPKYRLATAYVVAVGRLWGRPFPWPERVALDEADRVARWARARVGAEGACLVRSPVGMALRVAIAAYEAGLDLSGVTFAGGGEPPTPAKVAGITRTGARYIPAYVYTETGPVGSGCARPMDGTDVHLFEDSLAVIQSAQTVPGTDLEVKAFSFTTLLPTAPKLMLNAQSDDYGILETRACGCPLEDLGYRRHIRQVHSFGKFTGEGMTLVGTNLQHILEQILPARLGGTPLDYQFLEEEDEHGVTRVTLLVNPEIAIPSEQAVVEIVLESLRREGLAGGLARVVWGQGGTLRVKRMKPILTGRGKLLPLHVRHPTGPQGRPD